MLKDRIALIGSQCVLHRCICLIDQGGTPTNFTWQCPASSCQDPPLGAGLCTPPYFCLAWCAYRQCQNRNTLSISQAASPVNGLAQAPTRCERVELVILQLVSISGVLITCLRDFVNLKQNRRKSRQYSHQGHMYVAIILSPAWSMPCQCRMTELS